MRYWKKLFIKFFNLDKVDRNLFGYNHFSKYKNIINLPMGAAWPCQIHQWTPVGQFPMSKLNVRRWESSQYLYTQRIYLHILFMQQIVHGLFAQGIHANLLSLLMCICEFDPCWDAKWHWESKRLFLIFSSSVYFRFSFIACTLLFGVYLLSSVYKQQVERHVLISLTNHNDWLKIIFEKLHLRVQTAFRHRLWWPSNGIPLWSVRLYVHLALLIRFQLS